ncbi:MAG: carbohydrate-binding domain-containing protein [Eubacterium sp.]|nr:carbohydrate-binding domain-containing protein [Eubacterium sp.]
MRKRGLYITSMMIMTLAMAGCGNISGTSSDSKEVSSSTDSDKNTTITVESSTESAAEKEAEEVSTINSEMFTERDQDPSYDESEAVDIKLNGTSISCDSSSVSVEGSIVTIKKEGVYVLSGTLSDGQIIVDADSSENVQIVLNGVDITCSNSACIYVKNADKTFVTLTKGTENKLSDTGAEYEKDGDEKVDGVIYSKDDVTFNGEGSLTICAGYNHGIVGNDDVKFTGGIYNITATGKGIKANDSIRVLDGSYEIVSKDDALHTSNNEEEGKGYIYIAGGTFDLSSDDDGIHAEKDLTIDGGTINVAKSYEGLEGATITINGGDIDILASDDGMNATGTSQTAAATESGKEEFEGKDFNGKDFAGMDDVEWDFDGKFGRGMGGGGMFDAVEDAVLTINGGDIYVNANGDGIDSNGYLYVYGGTVVVDGPTNDGNGPLDTGYEGIIYSGTVIAAGSSGMAETFSEESSQYSILYNFTDTISEGTEVQLLDSDGNVIANHIFAKTGSSIVISSSDIKNGSYTIKAGDTEEEIEVSSVSTSAGVSGGFGGGFGGGPGGDFGPNSDLPDNRNMTPPDKNDDRSSTESF